MSEPSEVDSSRDDFELNATAPVLSPSAERLCDAKSHMRLSLFQELLDLVPLVVRDHILCQQLGNDRSGFTFVPIRSSLFWIGFTHVFSTVDCTGFPENKVNFTASKQYNRTTRPCETTKPPVNAGLEGGDRDTAVPLTVRGATPDIQNGSIAKINLTTRNQCLITGGGRAQDEDGVARADGGTTTEQVFDDNGVGQDNDYENKAYGGTEAAINAIERYVTEHVEDKRIASSGSIANTVSDVRTQEIGKTLGAHLRGDTPDGFLLDVEVSKWRDNSPVKWVFERVAGEADVRRSCQLKQPALVREISDATGATGARYRVAEEDGVRWERASITRAWMRDVVEAVCETVDYEPNAVREAGELTLRDWIDELTQAGTTEVLERAAGIEDPGADSSWNRSTLRKIHDLVVAGRDPSEVSR